MIIRDALRSLKRDFSKAVFYWLTFVIVTAFFFLFFNFSGAESSGLAFIESNGTITLVVILMIVICSIDIFFANSFFIKTKSKDIGVRLVCGATYVHIASYLLIQTAILLLTAMPAAGLISLGAIPLVNSFLANVMQTSLHIAITPDSLMLTGLIVGYIVFWLVLLNLSFAYLNTAGTMMNERNVTRNRGNGSMFNMKAGAAIGTILNTALFIVPVIGIWFVPPTVYLVLAVIGIYGFSGFVKNVVHPFCRKLSSESGLSSPDKMVLAGFFSTDLLVNSLNIMLYIVSVIALVSLLTTAHGKPVETVMVMTAYITACVLQSMTIMFRASSEYSGRLKYYMSLDQIGFVEEDLKKITFRETLYFFGFILITALLYIVTIFINMIRHGILGTGTVMVMIAVLIIPMVVFFLCTWLYYQGCIYPIKRER